MSNLLLLMLLIFVALGLVRNRSPRFTAVAMGLVILIYVYYAYYAG